MATHSSTLAWKIPWTEEPGGLQFMGSLRVGHDRATSLSLFTFMHWRRQWQPTPVFLPGESQGRGSLVGCRLRSCTESDTTEAIQQQQQQPYPISLMILLGMTDCLCDQDVCILPPTNQPAVSFFPIATQASVLNVVPKTQGLGQLPAICRRLLVILGLKDSSERLFSISTLNEFKFLNTLLLLLLSHFSLVQLCATPQTAAHQTPPSLGFSRQEHWSGLPFPSPMHERKK